MRLITGGLIVTALLGTCVLRGDAGDDFKLEAGYVSLFNGKDLAGWKYGKDADLTGKTETADKRFRVADGVIICEEGKGIKDLYTSKEFNKAFNLKMQFRASALSDSGVYVRGPQLQVRDFIRRKEMKGKLTKFKNDDWNDLDITVGSTVITTVKLNDKVVPAKDSVEVIVKDGVTMAKVNGKPIDITTKVEVSVFVMAKCLCNGELMENMAVPVTANKGVGLQAEVGKFEYRRIRIKEMP